MDEKKNKGLGLFEESTDNDMKQRAKVAPAKPQQPNMMDEVEGDPGFADSEKMPTIIKVVGVGGGGNNAINHMYDQHITGVSFANINTDKQALNNSRVPTRLLIGPNTTKGLGAGNKPEVARAAAEESEKEIAALFDDDTRMAFITAGMGGGTGTGAAPIVSKIAREKGILTIGIVTIPFLFEGQKKIIKALEGAREMQKYVDALLIINNERLTDIYRDLDIVNAFGKADDTLSIAASSISELITVHGPINLDFNDVNTTLRDGGVAIISSGYGEGENRVTKAIEEALRSPLLKNRDVHSSKHILMNIYFSPKATNVFKMDEINEINQFMGNFDNDVDVIWGHSYDESLGEKIKITILASGFKVSLEQERPADAVSPEKREATLISDSERMVREEYGETLTNRERALAETKYLVLKPNEIDNDDIIERLEKNPTFQRKVNIRREIDEMQKTAAANAAVVGKKVKEAQKSTSNQPASGSILFGADD